MSTADKTIAEHSAKIVENTDAIVTKADATVAFAVQTLDKDVLAIKNHLKKEEDQGISVSPRPPFGPLTTPLGDPQELRQPHRDRGGSAGRSRRQD
jgi:hypothetical protein